MRATVVGVLVPLVLLAAACGSDPGESVVPGTASPSAARSADALSLVGWWSVEAAGAAVGTVIALGDSVTVFQPCGALDGDWDATSGQGLFVASFSGGDGPCFGPSGPPRVSWLDDATGFRVEGSARVLLDDAGRAVAVLRPGGVPPVSPNRLADPAPPTPGPQRVAAASEPAALPEGVHAPTVQELARRWAPAQSRKAFVSFDADHGWNGSDGCNGSYGRYVLGDGGRLIATAGASTLIGCESSPAPDWVSTAARVGLAGGTLVFYDQQGAVLGSVVSAPAPAAPTTSPPRTARPPASPPPASLSASASPIASQAPSPSAAGPGPAVVLTEADSGKALALRVGTRVVVRLAPGAGSYLPAVSDAPSRLRRDSARGGYPETGVAEATFTALAPGVAQVSSQTDVACLHAEPRCLLPQRLFTVSFTIT